VYGMLYMCSLDQEAAQRFTDPNQALAVLNGLDWSGNPVLGKSLEDSITNSPSTGICYSSNVRGRHSQTPYLFLTFLSQDQFSAILTGPISPGCSYQPPSRCGGPEPKTCCEQVAAGAAHIQASVGIGSFMLLLAAILY
jgi:hypothetical protein